MPWTLSRIVKRVAVHASWLLITVATGGAWVFYFADAPTLARELFTGIAAFTSIAVLTAATYIFGGLCAVFATAAVGRAASSARTSP